MGSRAQVHHGPHAVDGDDGVGGQALDDLNLRGASEGGGPARSVSNVGDVGKRQHRGVAIPGSVTEWCPVHAQ